MHVKVFACDLDGTLAEDGVVAPETWTVLRRARRACLALILVTGRRLETFAADGPFAELFEAIVAEDGAAVYYPRNDSVVLPFGRLEPDIVKRLEALDVPLERGMAIAATWVPHDGSEKKNQETLAALPVGQAYLHVGPTAEEDAPTSGVVAFKRGRRIVPHVRHLHKYLSRSL